MFKLTKDIMFLKYFIWLSYNFWTKISTIQSKVHGIRLFWAIINVFDISLVGAEGSLIFILSKIAFLFLALWPKRSRLVYLKDWRRLLQLLHYYSRYLPWNQFPLKFFHYSFPGNCIHSTLCSSNKSFTIGWPCTKTI